MKSLSVTLKTIDKTVAGWERFERGGGGGGGGRGEIILINYGIE